MGGIRKAGNLFAGQFVVFPRMGDYNQNPQTDPTLSLRDGNINKISWVCLNISPVILIRDLGNGKGEEVTYLNSSFSKVPWSVELPLISSTSTSNFYNSSPPFQAGRIYFGQKIGSNYIVFLQGKGASSVSYELESENSDYIYSLKLDLTADGRVIDFLVIATETGDPNEYESSIVAVFRYYDGDDTFTTDYAPDYADFPYGAWIASYPEPDRKAYGFRNSAEYMMAWQYDAWSTYGDLPAPFTDSGGDSVAYAVTVEYKETASKPNGFIYADRIYTNWKQWYGSYWGDPYQALLGQRAMDYRSDADPIAIRKTTTSNIESILLYFP